MIAKKTEIKSKSLIELRAMISNHAKEAFGAEDESPQEIVAELLADRKGRTMDEILKALKHTNHSDAALRSAVKYIEINGWLDVTLTGPQREETYTLKSNVQPNTSLAAKSPKMFKLPETGIVDPVGRITASDGLDLAIWKAMSDRGARTSKQIVGILVMYGFNRGAVYKRLMSLVRKDWFVRKERTEGTHYILRRDTAMPAQRAAVEMPEPNTGRDELVTTYRPQEHKPVVAVEEHPATQPTKPPEPTSIPTPPLLATDTIRIMIWKVMSDYKEYTTPDIVLLLGDMAKTATSVATALSALDGEGWFDRKEIGRSPRYSYTLRRSIPMPTDMRRRKAEEKPAAQSEQTETQVTEKEITVHAVKNTPQAQAPLVEIAVKIKGQLFTSSEAKQLTSELSLLGYGHAAQRLNHPPKGLVTKTISIKGMEFTDAELEVLVSTLNATRFG